MVRELFLQRWRQKRAAAKHFSNGVRQVACEPPLAYVPVSSCAERRGNVFWFFVNGKEQNSCAGVTFAKPPRNLKTIQARHRYIKYENVRIQTSYRQNRSLSILSSSDDHKLIAKFVLEVCEHGPIIIDKQNANCGHKSSSTGEACILSPLRLNISLVRDLPPVDSDRCKEIVLDREDHPMFHGIFDQFRVFGYSQLFHHPDFVKPYRPVRNL